MNNLLKKTMAVVAGAALAVSFSSASNAAGNAGSKLAINIDQTNVSKHYDPAHIGHSHQCANCKKSYNQSGDHGAYSLGTSVCPFCQFTNQTQSSLYPATPYPANPKPSGRQNVDTLIQLWKRASNYCSADNIIIAGANNVNTMSGICRLALTAYSREAFDSIISHLNRSNIICDVTPEDVIVYWNKASNYATGDILAVAAAKRFGSVKSILKISVILYDKSLCMHLLDFVDSSYGRLVDPPTVADLKFYWNKAGNYETADRILLSGVRYLRSISELAETANISYNQSTKRAIEAMYSQVASNPHPQPNYPPTIYPAAASGNAVKPGSPSQYPPTIYPAQSRAFEQPVLEDDDDAKTAKTAKMTKNQAVTGIEISADAKAGLVEAAAELEKHDTAIDLTSEDIKKLNIEKIQAFAEKLNAGSYKQSEFLKFTKDSLKKRLKDEAMKNPHALELLNSIK